MIIKESKTYVNDSSDLALFIVKIHHVSKRGFIKFKGILSNKNCGYVYEIKNYKLRTDIPSKFGWRIK